MASDRDNRGDQGRPSTSNEGTYLEQDQLAQQLGELARSLHHKDTVQDTLTGIVRAAVDNVPGTRFAGITVVEARRKVNTQAWNDEVARICDRAQYETGQGPCLDAVYEQQTVRLSDMRTEQRWPEFTRRAAKHGIGSMLSLQLYVSGDNLGALNLYSRAPEAFNDESEHVGLLLACHAAIAMASARREHQLVRAMDTRDRIGQAKGILMERYNIPSDQAFSLLIRVSQNTNIKLRDIADHLTATGELAAGSHKMRTSNFTLILTVGCVRQWLRVSNCGYSSCSGHGWTKVPLVQPVASGAASPRGSLTPLLGAAPGPLVSAANVRPILKIP